MANEVAVKTEAELTMSERFTNKVLAEFREGVGDIVLTNFQHRLLQNYFQVADMVMKAAETKRKNKKNNQDPLPVTWQNIDMEKLSQSVVAAARIGWDPQQENHVSLIPFKEKGASKYVLTFMPGYRGRELRAVKYGLDVPDVVIVQVVYSSDRFKSYKKDRNNQVENYEFEIVNDFNRGEIVGGFYYHSFLHNPEKNKLVVLSLKEIEKRKPRFASVEFWGGEKDVWDNGKKVGKEHVDGWRDQMIYKTIYIAAYKDITIDSQKIDDDYLRLSQLENDFKESEVEEIIIENANKDVIDIQIEGEVDEGITDAEIVEMDRIAEELNNPPKGPGF